jgi:hypothetical protein
VPSYCFTGYAADGTLDEYDGRAVLENLLQTLIKVARPPDFRLEIRLEVLYEFLDPTVVGNDKYM